MNASMRPQATWCLVCGKTQIDFKYACTYEHLFLIDRYFNRKIDGTDLPARGPIVLGP